MKNIIKHSFLMLAMVGAISLTSCSGGWQDGEFKTFTETVYVDPETITLQDNDFKKEDQIAYGKATWDTIDQYGVGKASKDAPRGVKVTLNDPNDKYVQYSLNSDMSNAYTYKFEDNLSGYLKNLMANKKYYYRTSADGVNFTGAAKDITVANTLPRNLDVEGVINVRDLGGYPSRLGGHIKQNMYFRGGRLTDDRKEPNVLLTDRGYETLTKQLGVKTEIDLRSGFEETGNMNNDVLKDIEYHLVPMNTRGVLNILDEFKPSMKEAFSLYADESNYPIYVHCKIGTDRTGAVSFVMGALLGMETEALIRDYLYSNFAFIRSQRTIDVIENTYYPYLRAFEKNTLAECAAEYLLSCGVTQQQIDSIRNIMIEK